MKTFLRVIYTKILYRIPLKILLILLVIWTVLLIGFSSAWTYNLSWTVNVNTTSQSYDDVWVIPLPLNYYVNSNRTFLECNISNLVWYDSLTLSARYNYVWTNWKMWTFSQNITLRNWSLSVNYAWLSSNKIIYYSFRPTSATQSFSFDFDCVLSWDNIIDWDIECPTCPTCPDQYTSLECQTEYNLIPIEEVDQAYCESNNLCPAWWTPSDCPNVWVSNLFINDIFHPGAFNIIMNIPEEISRDYAYTNSWYNFNLDIEWYNVDYEKMQSVIDLQSYKPSSEDFTQIVWLLAPYTKIILFFVFLFIIWAWIKKPFKSKRL